MAAGVNNLTLVLNVADKGLRAGLIKAQKQLEQFGAGTLKAFSPKNKKRIDSYRFSVTMLAASIKKLRTEIQKTNAGVLAKELSGVGRGATSARRGLSGVAGAANVASKSTDRLSAASKRATISLGTMRKSSARTAEAIRSTALNMQYMITAMVGGAAAIGVVKFGAQFEKKLGEIDTLLDSNTVSIQQYQEQLIGLSKATPKTLLDLSGALYQIISAGIPAVEGAGGAFDILNQSQKLAVGSISETKQAADLLITTMAAFQNQNVMAAEASDKLTMIYQKGRTTIPQLSKAFGRAAPIAAQFGISLDELGGLMISLTRAGLNTNEAVTGIRALMSGLAKPTKKTQKLLKALGIQFGQAAIESRGFSGVLDEVITATGGNVDVLAQLFPNIRALLPAVISAGQGFDTFSSNVDMVTNSIGASDLAVQKQSDKFFFAGERLKSNFQGVIQDIAQKVLPGLMIGLSRLNRFISENSKEFAAAGVGAMKFFGAVGSIGGSTLFKTVELLLSVVTSLPGQITLVGIALFKLTALFARLAQSSAAGLLLARTALNPAMWAAAGTKAGAAGGTAAMTAAGGAVTVGSGGLAARFMAGLSGLARMAGPVGIGLTVGYMLYEGISQAIGEEEERLNEEAQRKEDLNLQKAVDRLRKAYREGRGVDVTEAAAIRSKERRGEVIIPEGGVEGDAKTVKQIFDERLREARASAQRALKDTGMDSVEISKELNKTEKLRRSVVLTNVVEHVENMIKAGEAGQKEASERSVAALNKLRNEAQAKADDLRRQIAEKSAQALPQKTQLASTKKAIESAASAGRKELDEFILQAGLVFENLKGENVLAAQELVSAVLTQKKEAATTAKNAAAAAAELSKAKAEMIAESFQTAGRFDRPLKSLKTFQDRIDKAETNLRGLQAIEKEHADEYDRTLNRLATLFGGLKADGLAMALNSEKLQDTSVATTMVVKHLRSGFGGLRKTAGQVGISQLVTQLSEANGKVSGITAMLQGIQNLSFANVFSSFVFPKLPIEAQTDVEAAARPENLRKQLDALLRGIKAAQTTTRTTGGSGRRRAAANFESLLNRLRKQRIRLEDKLEKIQRKSNKLAAERKKIEAGINSTIKAREDKGGFTYEDREALMESIRIRQEGDRASLKSRQEGQLDALKDRQKKEREKNEELRRKNQEDFDREMKKRLGKHSKNAAKRKAIESEIERIRLATEEKVGTERLAAIREAASKDVGVMLFGDMDTKNIELTAKEMHDTLDEARKRFNEEIVRKETDMPGYTTVGRAKRDFFKKEFSIGFNEFVEQESFIERAKIEKAISDLVEKRSVHVKNEGRLGRANAEELKQLTDKHDAEKVEQQLKQQDEVERAEKAFFDRRSAHNKRITDENKRLQKEAIEDFKRAVSYGDTGLVVDMLFDGLENIPRKLKESGFAAKSVATELSTFFNTSVDPISKALIQARGELNQIKDRLERIQFSENQSQKEINKLTEERRRKVEQIAKMEAAVSFARAAHSALQRESPDSLSGVVGSLLPNTGAGARSRKMSQDAAQFARENKDLIDAAKNNPEMKKLLDRMGISDDAKVRDSFARRASTGSMVDLGAGNEEIMQVLGMIERGFDLGNLGDLFGTDKLDGLFLGTNTLVDALDTAIPGMGNAVRDAMQDLYDSDLHMKLFEDMSGASAEFAKGNVGALFDVATGFAQKVSDKMTSLLSSAARGLGNMIGSSVGKFAGDTFAKTVGPILTATITMIAENVLAPAADALGASFGIMTGGISDAFVGVSSEERLFSSTQQAQQDARDDLSSGTSEIRRSASERVEELDAEIAAASDSQQREDLILQRREVLSSMEQQLLEARTNFAESERERVEEHRRNNPVTLVDQAFSKALEMADKVAVDVPILVTKVIDGLIENLPTLLEKMAGGFADTVSSIAEKLPDLMLTIVSSLIDAIPKLAGALAEMIPALIDGILKALIEILSRFGEIIGPLVDGAVTAIIESLILIVDQLPEIAVALVQGIVQATTVLAQQAPRIISALIAAVPAITFALIGAVPQIIAEVIKGIPDIIKGFSSGLKQAAIDFGRMINRTIQGLASVGGNKMGAGIGGGLGLAAGLGTALAIGSGPVGIGVAALLGGGLGGLVGSFFHEGGMVGKGQRNPATAAIMRSLGAAQFAKGGMVEMMNRSLSSNPLSSMRRAIDDVPAVLQAGEAVLNRNATAVLGEETINQLNAGGLIQGGDTSVTLNIQPDPSGVRSAAAALLPMLIGGVNAEVSRPGSKLRNAINSSSGRPIGSMSVPVSKRSTS